MSFWLLVVGATGQLGTAVVRKLIAAGRPVRAFVRPGSSARAVPGAELALGDLCVSQDIDLACRNVEAVICTANSVLPGPGDRLGDVEHRGYGNLLEACRRHGVAQFVFISAPVTPLDEKVPSIRWKRWNEGRIRESGIPYTIFRAPPFMDSWLAVIGSRLPLRDSENPTLGRPFWFSRAYLRAVGNLMERNGWALVQGPPERLTSFLAVRDAASFLVNAIGHPSARNAAFDIGGPQPHSWTDIVGIYSRVLGRPIRPFPVAPALYRAQQLFWKPFSAAASNQMGLSWLLASCDTVVDMRETAPLFGVSLTSVETFLREKASFGERRGPSLLAGEDVSDPLRRRLQPVDLRP
jgi:uncharacterized protein YbjT (DUF2867 family)